jgi:chromosome segregation ATPase
MSKEIQVAVRNIGGITETSISLSDGVNLLVGRNATNRTSFLRAVMAACGSQQVSVKSDAEEGQVTLEVDGETYTRRLCHGQTGGVRVEGDAYLDDSTVADLFAFLLESNEARQAVTRQEDLRDVIMRPVDTEEINAEIEEVEAAKRRVSDRLDELDGLEQRLPTLEQRRQQLESQRAEKQAALDEKRDEIAALEAAGEDATQEQGERESKLEELKQVRSELESTEYDLETQRERLASLRQERSELQDGLAATSAVPDNRLSEISDQLSQLRQEKRRLEADISELQKVIQFNESRIEETEETLFAAASKETTESTSVTDQLLEPSTTTCWTCGSTVETAQIEKTVTRLRELSQAKVSDVSDIDAEIEQLQTEQQSLEERERTRARQRRELEQTEEQITETEANIADLEQRTQSLRSTIEELEAAVTDTEHEEHQVFVERQREANELEFEIEQLEAELDDVTDEIETIEATLDEREELTAEREQLRSALTDLRTRIERIERDAVDSFNQNMDAVLELLEYSNIDRVWIERVERQVREGRQNVTKSAFRLHVVRSTASGSAYEDTVRNLSESEREVIGLVFALAGYLAHEVYKECPFMLLDSLEAIDSDRIAALIEYFQDKVPYIVAALLPEDAPETSEYRRIESI